MSSTTPPAEPPSFDGLTAQVLLAETEEILHTAATLHDHIAATITSSSATFANVVRPIVDAENRAMCRLNILGYHLAQLSSDHDVRRAARQAESKTEAARVSNVMRHDVAALVSAVYHKENSTPSGDLDAQDRHLLSCIHAKYVRSGAGLSGRDERERFRQASRELSGICAAAQDTMIEPEEGIWFERADLSGVPEDILSTMVQDGTRIQVTFRKNHVAAVMRNATKSGTRRRLLVADRNRLPQNIARLSRAIALRDQMARSLGYEHHAALKMETRMAPSVAYVKAQLEDLYEGLRPIAQIQTDRLAECKKRHSSDNDNEDPTDEVHDWDNAFYGRLLKQEASSVDLSLLSEYFEVNHTLHAMLDVFHDLFSLDFRPVTISTWHEDVMSFQVWDTLPENVDFLGHLYVDLFQREGKYRGAHCVGIQPGFLEQDGTRNYPAIALVCCYAHPSKSKLTLLQHKEVTTMFHELGHAIHSLVSKTKYALPQSRDFSEIPSNMLENWTWIPEVLVRIGRHYTTLDTALEGKGTLPRQLAEAVCATRNSNRAKAILAHIWPALFDLAIHTPGTHRVALEMDTTKMWNTIKQHITTTGCGPDPRDWGAGQARFIHMFRYNDVGYFSYPLSMAYATDLFASNFALDPMSKEAGRTWRCQVLEPGASRPEMDILKDFLGREPSIHAIVEELKSSKG